MYIIFFLQNVYPGFLETSAENVVADIVKTTIHVTMCLECVLMAVRTVLSGHFVINVRCLTVILIVVTKHISSNEKYKNNTYILFDDNNFSPPAQKGSGSFSVRLSVCPPVCLSVYKLTIFFLQPLDQIQPNKVHVHAILMGKGF